MDEDWGPPPHFCPPPFLRKERKERKKWKWWEKRSQKASSFQKPKLVEKCWRGIGGEGIIWLWLQAPYLLPFTNENEVFLISFCAALKLLLCSADDVSANWRGGANKHIITNQPTNLNHYQPLPTPFFFPPQPPNIPCLKHFSLLCWCEKVAHFFSSNFLLLLILSWYWNKHSFVRGKWQTIITYKSEWVSSAFSHSGDGGEFEPRKNFLLFTMTARGKEKR